LGKSVPKERIKRWEPLGLGGHYLHKFWQALSAGIICRHYLKRKAPETEPKKYLFKTG
jgi:hypothetical protein